MKLKQWVSIVAVALCVMGAMTSLATAEEEAGSSLSMGVELDYASRYIWRGFDLLEDNSPAVQPSAYLEYALSDELSAGYFFWGNYRLVSNNPEFEGEDNDFDEIDHELYLSYALSDTLSLDLGYIYYYYPSTSTGTDTQEIYAGVSMALNDYLSTGFKVYYDIEESSGYYANLSLEGEYPLNDLVTASGSIALGYMDYDGDYMVDGGFSDFSDLPLSAGFAVDMGRGLSSFTTVNYSISLDDDINTKNESWLMAGIAYDF